MKHCELLCTDTVSHQRRTELSATLPQAPQSHVYDIIQQSRHISVLFSNIITSSTEIFVLLCDEIIHTLATIPSAMIPGHL